MQIKVNLTIAVGLGNYLISMGLTALALLVNIVGISIHLLVAAATSCTSKIRCTVQINPTGVLGLK